MDGSWVAHVLNWIPTCIWLVCGLASIKEQTYWRHIFKRDWTMSLNIDNYFTLNNEHNSKDLCIQLRNQQTRIFDNHNWIKGNLIFQFGFCICFIVDLLMQCEFRCANLISGNWRTYFYQWCFSEYDLWMKRKDYGWKSLEHKYSLMSIT